MESPNTSAREKLDQMLRDEKITQEEYLRLSKAMAETRLPCAKNPSIAQRKLRKVWKDRKIGGVCAGLAVHLGIDPILLRVLGIVFFIPCYPFPLLMYALLYFLLPWDDEEAAKAPRPGSHPVLFATGGVIFTTLLPFLLCQIYLSKFPKIFQEIKAEFPFLEQKMLDAIDGYQVGIHFPWSILYSVLIVTLATWGYVKIHNNKLRLYYSVAFFFFAVGWPLALIISTYTALFYLPRAIH
jgi:phage shock protein PspC (stress-responsive transcriptional regulator)